MARGEFGKRERRRNTVEPDGPDPEVPSLKARQARDLYFMPWACLPSISFRFHNEKTDGQQPANILTTVSPLFFIHLHVIPAIHLSAFPSSLNPSSSLLPSLMVAVCTSQRLGPSAIFCEVGMMGMFGWLGAWVGPNGRGQQQQQIAAGSGSRSPPQTYE